jgi:hypothetical protein
MIDFQSSATAPWPCPIGTFANSQQHARVIYGWVHGRQQIRVPRGRQKSFSLLPSLALVHAALSSRIRVNSRNSRKRLSIAFAAKSRFYPCPSACHARHVSHGSMWWLKKGRNYKTNPIFIASLWRPKTTEENFSKSMISETHQLLRPCIFRSSHLRHFK